MTCCISHVFITPPTTICDEGQDEKRHQIGDKKMKMPMLRLAQCAQIDIEKQEAQPWLTFESLFCAKTTVMVIC